MRSRLFVPLFLVLVVGCDGNYRLGDMHENHGGTGNLPAGGSAGNNAGGSSAGSAASGGGSVDTDVSSGASDGGTAGSTSTGLVISPSSLPNARLSISYLVRFGANGGVPKYAFSLLSGALPAGLSLTPDGTLSGSPQELGAFSFVVQVTDRASTQAQASFQLQVSRTRWLASETFVSSASAQTILSLIDLEHPDADPLVLDSQSALNAAFSGDGRWMTYALARSAAQYDLYIVDTASEKPKGQFLFATRTEIVRHNAQVTGCQWAPDSSRLACIKSAGSLDALTSEVVYFDTSGAALGPELSVGPGERDLTFLDRDTLVYGYGADDFARVEWHGPTPGAPEPLGVGGGSIAQQSPDGARALIRRSPFGDPTSFALVDFRLGQAQALDMSGEAFSLSRNFDAAFDVDPPASGDTGLGSNLYYSISGVQATQVGKKPVLQSSTSIYPPYLAAGHTVIRTDGNQVWLDTVSATDVIEQVVPGDYQAEVPAGHIVNFDIDPTGSWIWISTARLDAQRQQIDATAKQWLSHVQADVASPTQLVGQGYSINSIGGSALFSPDSRRLLLYGYSPGATPAVVPFRLFDLSDPSGIKPYTLDVPCYWGDAGWSADSTYASIICGNPLNGSRPLLVVDALAPNATPREIVSCNSNPAPLPGCPGSARFQP